LKSDDCLEKVNNQVAEARAKGVTGVPFTIIDGKWAVSGGQSAPVFVKVRFVTADYSLMVMTDKC
jgi:predicted DsbA family dithiol-disulfide isomerase